MRFRLPEAPGLFHMEHCTSRTELTLACLFRSTWNTRLENELGSWPSIGGFERSLHSVPRGTSSLEEVGLDSASLHDAVRHIFIGARSTLTMSRIFFSDLERYIFQGKPLYRMYRTFSKNRLISRPHSDFGMVGKLYSTRVPSMRNRCRDFGTAFGSAHDHPGSPRI